MSIKPVHFGSKPGSPPPLTCSFPWIASWAWVRPCPPSAGARCSCSPGLGRLRRASRWRRRRGRGSESSRPGRASPCGGGTWKDDIWCVQTLEFPAGNGRSRIGNKKIKSNLKGFCPATWSWLNYRVRLVPVLGLCTSAGSAGAPLTAAEITKAWIKMSFLGKKRLVLAAKTGMSA